MLWTYYGEEDELTVMTTDRDSSDEIEEAREYDKLIDATRFCKSFKTYLEEHAPQVLTKTPRLTG